MTTDRRKRILVNRYEIITDQELRRVAEEYGARVCPKVRIADVINITGSGIDSDLYGYALRAHFDFLVANEETQLPLFAVEFDGPHHDTDPDTILRDARKNQICERFSFPLLRIDSDFLVKHRRFTVLSWLAELWFLAETFDQMQARGKIAPEESFWHGAFVTSDDRGRWVDQPFDLSFPSKGILVSAWRRGATLSHVPEIITRWRRRAEDLTQRTAYAVVPISTDRFIIGSATCRAFTFRPVTPQDLAEDLAVIDAADKLERYLRGELSPATEDQFVSLRERTREGDGWIRIGMRVEQFGVEV